MKPIVLVMLIAILFCAVSCVHKTVQLKLVTEDYPPLTYAVDDSITGYGTEIVRAIQKEVKSNDPIKLMDWEIAYNIAVNEPNVVIFTMEKTPERDTSFYWVGPIGKNKTYLYAKAGVKQDIQSINDAKVVKAIATTTDWFSEKYLQKNNFNNLKSNSLPTDAVKIIMSGDADLGTFTDLTVNQIVKKAGFEPGSLVPVYELLDTDFYIAISKQTNPEIAKQWQKAFNKLKKNGTLDKLQNQFLK